jgi:hypothetical protein
VLAKWLEKIEIKIVRRRSELLHDSKGSTTSNKKRKKESFMISWTATPAKPTPQIAERKQEGCVEVESDIPSPVAPSIHIFIL